MQQQRSTRPIPPLTARQQGVVLVIALVLMASLSVIAVASVNSGVTGLKIARNIEERMDAFQLAQSAIDAVVADSSNLPTTGPLNQLNAVSLVDSVFTVDTANGETLSAAAERTGDCRTPPRLSNGTSIVAFSAFSYRVHADVNRSATGRGVKSIRQGLMVLGPKC